MKIVLNLKDFGCEKKLFKNCGSENHVLGQKIFMGKKMPQRRDNAGQLQHGHVVFMYLLFYIIIEGGC